MNNENIHLIAALNKCAAACNYCATACLGEEDVQMMTDCIRLDIDCAELCSVTANFIARGSVHGQHLLGECAELCRLCAEECEKHVHMEHCITCAKACRQCEDACKVAA